MDKSPLPKDIKEPFIEEPQFLNFTEAIEEILDGNKVSKMDWSDNAYYGYLLNGVLTLHKPDGKDYAWILNDGDLSGKDYFVL